MADKDEETDQEALVKILLRLRKIVLRRAIMARERSQETFGEEIVALNDIDQALHNNRTDFVHKE
ncbi:MAG: hypothetical protein OK456_09485 [Thaumarchaeota archaeon]|nr:hypothetical protein [Nitrososphaerota archaeon]